MTNKEAIQMIENDKRLHHDYLSSEYRKALNIAIEALKARVPEPVMSETDHSWGIHRIEPVCPGCGCFLARVSFIGEGKKINYCDHCGQAVDWKEWKYDE